MKMVKSLLLGSAAGLVAIAGAQAADLPVKAKPVEYVKICSAYGAGFYYIPGTDICLRVGGYVWMTVVARRASDCRQQRRRSNATVSDRSATPPRSVRVRPYSRRTDNYSARCVLLRGLPSQAPSWADLPPNTAACTSNGPSSSSRFTFGRCVDVRFDRHVLAEHDVQLRVPVDDWPIPLSSATADHSRCRRKTARYAARTSRATHV
jgi:hypothetical protein